MNRIDRIEEKLDRVLDHQGEIKGDLREHMRRTELLEKKVEILEPLVSLVKGVVVLGALSGGFYGVVRLIQTLTP